MRRVAITGLDIVSPLGNTPELFFANLMAGKSGIRRLQADFTDQLDIKIAAQADFDPLQHLTKHKASSLDRVSQFALYAANQAINDARLDLAQADKHALAFIWAPAWRVPLPSKKATCAYIAITPRALNRSRY